MLGGKEMMVKEPLPDVYRRVAHSLMEAAGNKSRKITLELDFNEVWEILEGAGAEVRRDYDGSLLVDTGHQCRYCDRPALPTENVCIRHWYPG